MNLSNIFKPKELSTVEKIILKDDVNKLIELLQVKQANLKGAIVILLSGDRKYYETFVINLEMGDTVGALDLVKHDIEHNGVPKL